MLTHVLITIEYKGAFHRSEIYFNIIFAGVLDNFVLQVLMSV